MTEQLDTGNNHNDARKLGAFGLSVALLASSFPSVGRETVSETRQIPTIEHVVDHVAVDGPSTDGAGAETIDIAVGNEYREDFHTTPEDAVVSYDEVGSALSSRLSEEDLRRVFDVQVVGSASAEDENPGGGVQQPSEANGPQGLAGERELLTVEPVTEWFTSKGVDLQQEVIKNEGEPARPLLEERAVEDSWTNETLTEAESLAGQFGYDNIDDMITRYNDDNDSVPPKVHEFLQPLLNAKRGAHVIVRLLGSDGTPQTLMITQVHDKVVIKDIMVKEEHRRVDTNELIGYIPEVEEMKVIPENHPRDRVAKDDMYRRKANAPRGNGAKPVRFGGGVPYNPTPSNFRK